MCKFTHRKRLEGFLDLSLGGRIQGYFKFLFVCLYLSFTLLIKKQKPQIPLGASDTQPPARLCSLPEPPPEDTPALASQDSDLNLKKTKSLFPAFLTGFSFPWLYIHP